MSKKKTPYNRVNQPVSQRTPDQKIPDTSMNRDSQEIMYTLSGEKRGKYQLYYPAKRVKRMAVAGVAALILKDSLRDLPQPLDIGNYMGNFVVSVPIGALFSGVGVPNIMDRSRFFSDHPNRMRAGLITAAVAAGLAINALVETKTGINTGIAQFLYEHGPGARELVQDNIDLASGVAGAAAGTYAAKIGLNPNYQPTSEL